MNRPLSIAWTRLGASAGLAALLGACAVQPASPGETDSRELPELLANGRQATQLSPIAPAPSTCERDLNGALVLSPDPCSGAGASRVLVRLGDGATCDTVLDLTASTGVRVSRQFPNAPADVRDHFCAIDVIDGDQATAKVPALLASLCAAPLVSVAVHDCNIASAGMSPPAFPADAFVTKRTSVHVESHKEEPVDEPAAGPHSCDTCGFVISDMLYVNIPLSMVTTGDATMIVRSLDAEVPDRAIQPPAGAQSFVVPQIGLPDAAPVRVYAPGQVPPPKS